MRRALLVGDNRKSNSPIGRILHPGMDQAGAEGSFTQRVLLPLAERLSEPSSALMRSFNLDEVRFRLMRAGFPRGLRARDFVLMKWIGLAIGFFIFVAFLMPTLLAVFGWPFNPVVALLFAGAGALYGFKIPDVWLSMITKKRQS